MIEVKGLTFRYSPEQGQVLRGIDLTIPSGSHVGLVGSNGSGKSTFGKHLNALLQPEEGVVMVDGLDVANAANAHLARQKVGMVFQNPDNQIVATIVEDDVAFGPENLGLPPDEIGRRVEWALATTGLTGLRLRSPATLSGGQRQRLAIASVLAMRPRHLVFDEPTSMLDPAGRDEVLAVMDVLRDDEGITIIHITHHMEELLHADTVVALDAGTVAFEGPPARFFGDDALLVKLGIQVPPLLLLTRQLQRAGLVPGERLPRTPAELALWLSRSRSGGAA